MKNLSIKLLLIIVGVLLLVNIFLLLSGGYWSMTHINKNISYKINRLTGKTYMVVYFFKDGYLSSAYDIPIPNGNLVFPPYKKTIDYYFGTPDGSPK